MKPEEYFDRILLIEPLYEPEDRFCEPFYYFAQRFQSLQRHWELNKDFLEAHSSLVEQVELDSSEKADVFDMTSGVDLDYFPQYVRLSTLSISLSLVENVLGDISEQIAVESGVPFILDERNIPYIDKHILWLTRGCGLELTIPKELRKRLTASRELRNRFLHHISRDIPEDIQKVIGEMVSSATADEANVTNDFIEVAMIDLAEMTKRVELAYWQFSDSK